MFGPALKRRTLEAALRDAGDKSVVARCAAIADLAAHAEEARPRVVEVLESSLRDADPRVRAAAATALADVRGIEALPSLLFAVEDPHPYVRQMALSAIGEIGDARAGQRLRRALADARPEVRFQAVIAFVRVAPEDAVEPLLEALADGDASIRYIAIRMAEEHAEQQGVRIEARLLPAIAGLLGDPDAAVRVGAAVALARAGDRAGESVLADVVAGKIVTREAEDEAMAVELAGELGLTSTSKELERRAFGLRRFRAETFAWHATVALARMGHPRATARIVSDLGARSRDRRTLAVAAAGRARIISARGSIEAMRGDEACAEQEAVATALEQLSRTLTDRELS